MADFQRIKEQVTIEAAAQMLGLELRAVGAAMRGPCPACKTGGPRALVVTPSKGLFYCFSAGIGGDLISLWGHVEKCSLADAGRQIADNFAVEEPSAPVRTSAPVHRSEVTTPPAPEQQKVRPQAQPAPTFDAHAFSAKLTYTDEVAALGFSEEDAERFGVGVYRGKLYIPLRHSNGSIACFLDYAGGTLKAPARNRWLEPSNVVPLVRKSA